ncbi:hypothetical protein HY572_04055 [Candidatus Micrarchaeota archaeon]|nr:hypothetical protein [Candidatus Micrarchaeota archaeon]
MVEFEVIGLAIVILLVFLYMIKVVLDLQATISSSISRVESKLDGLEQTASHVTSDMATLKRSLNDKVDRSYVEKRLVGLSELLKKDKKR